jgi:hypothetical protein
MSYIVCGWYTPNYAHWLDTLVPSLEAVGAPHSFVLIHKPHSSWQRTTMLKASQVRAAMDWHPGKTIIFLDVDCRVTGPLDELANTDCDFACFMHTVVSRRSVKLHTWSGTLLIQPTPRARSMVEIWEHESERQHREATDQTSLALAVSRVPGLRITALERKWCAARGEAGAVIEHDSASAEIKKPSLIHRIQNWRLAA